MGLCSRHLTLILPAPPTPFSPLQPTPTTTGAFEVTINGKLVHSKLGGAGFPTAEDNKKFIRLIKEAL